MFIQKTYIIYLLIAVLSVVIFIGCRHSGLGGLYPVSGKITHQGKPIGNVTINLVPEDPTSNARSASAISNADGNFVFTTLKPNDGAFPGQYKVTLSKYVNSLTPEETSIIESNGQTAKSYGENIFPKKYHNAGTTDLTFIVQKGKNELVIDVPEELTKVVFPAWSTFEAQKPKGYT
ncbi:MAG: carboxypeptidase-like regulatory domain-containing protein, partial [Planctomycetaceae bacterium]|nr:carboxypeptidase-like regulatory domain-containing protein [Planctomycetaceae bacterium]